jgi:hypothetical protein
MCALEDPRVSTLQDEGRSVTWFVDKERRRIEVTFPNQITICYPLNAIPDSIYEAMATALDGNLEPAGKVEELYGSTIMKPAVCTLNASGPFPVNAATKIVRLTLTDEAIQETVDDLEGELLALQGRPFQQTLQERIDIYKRLYFDDSRIDRMRLGAVEMYQDVTYSNIQRDPRVALSFMWSRPHESVALGYQINCLAEISRPKEPFYRFMRCLRSLFSSRFLDTRGTEYACAYKLWVCEAMDKSLVPKPGFVP